jgi:hypothetical protein
MIPHQYVRIIFDNLRQNDQDWTIWNRHQLYRYLTLCWLEYDDG